MWMLGPLGFTSPWLLLSLAALPVLWVILRAVPPAPVRRRFPGVALLLGLRDLQVQPDRTPWWLLLLRMLALAAAIIAFAGPVLNPRSVAAGGGGPILIVADASWASARDWPRRLERARLALEEARASGRPAAVLALSDQPPQRLVFSSADTVLASLGGFAPQPWEPLSSEWNAILPEGPFETLWLSDGLAREARAALVAALQARGPVVVHQPARPVVALLPAQFEDGALTVPVLRAGLVESVEVAAIGRDPNGIERDLARETVQFGAADQAKAVFVLPSELRNRVSRFEVVGLRSAGAVALADDALKRRKVALVAGGAAREGLELLAPTHYLRQALAPNADILDGTLSDSLMAAPDVVILADVVQLAEAERLESWVARGGLLIRFAGPRMAASDTANDPLLPVQLRSGDRSVGGSMSWGEPRSLAPFAETSPFAGLTIPADVSVRAQVLAEPAPELSAKTIAALADGTPLVTRERRGEGWVVLFHVTANAEWSSLPLSGLFVQMLDRLAVSSRVAAPSLEEMIGTTWQAERRLDAYGALSDVTDALAGVRGEVFATALAGPAVPPGIYASGDRRMALNVMRAGQSLAVAEWPATVRVEGMSAEREMPLKGALLLAALGLLLLDVFASLAVSGRLLGARVAAVALSALPLLFAPQLVRAEMDPARAISAASEVVLAYVVTGDAEVDRIAEAGLRGLSDVLRRRTSVEPGAPMAVDLETDDLALFTLLYWPITESQPSPSPVAYARLNRFLRSGGMILFDTRDADIAGFGSATGTGRRLQTLAAPLDIPALDPIATDHVLTRTFYLIQEFPGRHSGRSIWVEAAPLDAEIAEGMPFRNLNDGVTPIVIGGNDWAAAWAIDARGQPLAAVGRGVAGERQRELAYRFGVNLVMHVLTGNYKSDQVHVPALLERLGQ
jgi:hypothetical protein